MRAHGYLAALLFTMGAAIAIANDTVERHHSFDASGLARLDVEHGVGEIMLVPTDGETIEVELRLDPNRNNGWFRRTPDVSDMDLDARTRGDGLALTFKEKNVASDWIIHVPASLTSLSIDAGVGEVRGSLPPMTATVNVGVGSVRLDAERAAVGNVELNAGVGDTRISGGAAAEEQRAFVSSTSLGRGDGEYEVRIKVGVGDAALTLR